MGGVRKTGCFYCDLRYFPWLPGLILAERSASDNQQNCVNILLSLVGMDLLHGSGNVSLHFAFAVAQSGTVIHCDSDVRSLRFEAFFRSPGWLKL